MRISRLVIENFRSIEKLDLPFGQVNAVIGPNNSGKSNILGAIQRVLGRDFLRVSDFSEEDVFGRDTSRDIRIAITFDPPLQYQKFKTGPSVQIPTLTFEYTRYKVGEHAGERRLEQGCLDAKGNSVMVLAKAPKKGEQHQFAPVVGIPPEVREQVPLIYLAARRPLIDQLPGARYSLLRRLFEDIDKSLDDPSENITIQRGGLTMNMSRRERFDELMQATVKLLRTKGFEDLETSIRDSALLQLGLDPAKDADKLQLLFAPQTSMDFYKALEIRVREGTFEINATELGEGIQNTLVIAILQAFEQRRKKGALLLIEEPEMYLHPQMQRSLHTTLRTIGKSNQLIYTTHSPHFVAIPDYQDILVVRKPGASTEVTKSGLTLQAKERERLVKECDPERNELFFARRVILVEGDTEKLAFPEYAKHLQLDLDRRGVTIVEVGGKRNLLPFVDIAVSFGIPIGVVYDKDSSDYKDKRDEEAVLNKELDALASGDSVKVWWFDKNYEDELRKALGEKEYQSLCSKVAAEAGRSKPVQARLIAIEEQKTPAKIEDILKWAVGSRTSETLGDIGGRKVRRP